MTMRPAIFLDRDGTLIEEVNYLNRVEQIRLLPGAPQALRDLAEAGFALVLVTNQSGIARGLLTEPLLMQLHAVLIQRLQAEGVHLDGIYYCPHHPDHGPPEYRRVCGCRKPATGLLERARADLGLDFRASWAVGDKVSDLAGARRLGCRTVLVLTGHGREQRRLLTGCLEDAQVAADLPEAARRILGTVRPPADAGILPPSPAGDNPWQDPVG